MAVENILTPELRPSRIALVFAFGLLHGLGFAGVLSELGLPRSEFLTALLSFNLGVEAGQLAVIALAFLLVGLPFRNQRLVPPEGGRPRLLPDRGGGAVLVGAAGVFLGNPQGVE